MIHLYDYLPSGNGYKIRLLLTQLELAYEVTQLNLAAGDTQESAFLAKNPNGKIPTVELDDGRMLFESHAIAFYFAEGTKFVPDDAYERALMWQWMCFEQYSLEPFIGTLRYWRSSLGQTPKEIGEERYREKIDGGHRALAILDAQLDGRDWVATGLRTFPFTRTRTSRRRVTSNWSASRMSLPGRSGCAASRATFRLRRRPPSKVRRARDPAGAACRSRKTFRSLGRGSCPLRFGYRLPHSPGCA